ncbi:MAG: ketopantoate reductase family protein [Clostridiales bacterium]|nr:ketopantoate reductase family protein [Clostridiales bacterium]
MPVKRIETVYFAGLGAVGCAYAGVMQDSEPGLLKVVANRDRIEKYRVNGIHINEKRYDFDFVEPLDAAKTDKGTPAAKADLIIICVKYHQLGQAIKDIKGFVGEDTIIMSLLNGIDSEEIIGREYGPEKLLYSYCVGIDAVRKGIDVSFSTNGKIVFGEKCNETHSDKVLAVEELFRRTGVAFWVPEDMIREQWFKFMVNVGGNQVSAVLGANYGTILGIREASELMRAAAQEVIDLAVRMGIAMSDKDMEEFFRIFGKLGAEGKTSMLQDVEAGRKTEVEIFSGAVIELAEKYQVPVPVNRTLFNIIRAMEKMYMK